MPIDDPTTTPTADNTATLDKGERRHRREVRRNLAATAVLAITALHAWRHDLFAEHYELLICLAINYLAYVFCDHLDSYTGTWTTSMSNFVSADRHTLREWSGWVFILLAAVYWLS